MHVTATDTRLDLYLSACDESVESTEGSPDREHKAALALAPVLMPDAETELSLHHEGSGRYRGMGVQVETTISTRDAFRVVTVKLRLTDPLRIHFFGVRIGPLRIDGQTQFFGEVPGFIEYIGVIPAGKARDDRTVASMFAMVGRPDSGMVLAGIDGPCDDASAFFLKGDALYAGWRPDRVRTGEWTCRVLVGFEADPLVLLQRFGRAMAPRGRCGTPPTGWNSWDYYGGAISMRDVRRELTALRHLQCGDGLHYVCVDMGWEEAWGHWGPNRKFPARVGDIAQRIRAAGRLPGIWLAPLLVSIFTPLARFRQDLFLRDAEGSLIMVEDDMPCGPALLLDFSLPEVREMVAGWFTGLRRAGFELFKIDYIYSRFVAHAAHSAGHYGKAAFVRAIFETIRSAVGDDAHIINCGGLKEAALGLIDSARVTTDIHNFWGHIRNNACQLASSFWMHGNLWTNDPDFAIARGPHNCDARWLNMPHRSGPLRDGQSFWMRGPPASRDDLRLWLSAVRLTGGSLFLADSMHALDADGRRDLDRLFPPLEAGFIPLDLFDRPRPGIWMSQDAARPCVGLFNWEDTAQTLPLPPPLQGGVTGKDFWSGQPRRLNEAITLPERSGVLLNL